MNKPHIIANDPTIHVTPSIMSEENVELGIDLIAGFISGGASIICSQPLDTLLIVRQAKARLPSKYFPSMRRPLETSLVRV